ILSIRARGERLVAGHMLKLSPGVYIVTVVSDTGGGMEEETRRRASEPFFTTKDLGRGTGLGLSMVDGLADQSGGVMRIRSELGLGTTVELWLPASEAQSADREGAYAQSSVASIGPVRVLVVDDDSMVRVSTGAMIEDLGHLAVEAASAADALDVLRSPQEIDLVLTDDAMPGVTGIRLADQINAVRPGLPVVIAT